jgi:hypothetical protein
MQSQRISSLLNSLLVCGLAAYVALSGVSILYLIQVYLIEVMLTFFFLIITTVIVRTPHALLMLGKSTYFLIASFYVPLIILASVMQLPLMEITSFDELQSTVGTGVLLLIFGTVCLLKLFRFLVDIRSLQTKSTRVVVESVYAEFKLLIGAPLAGFFLGVVFVMVPLLLVNELFGTSFYLHTAAFIPVFVFLFQLFKSSSTTPIAPGLNIR